MELLEIIKNRRSVRAFQAKEIPEEVVDKLIEALIWAPSAGNLQSRKFYFVFNQEIKDRLNETTFSKKGFLNQAPLVIVACADDKVAKKFGEGAKNLSLCDVSASVQNMILLSYSEGLGTCWVCSFDGKAVSELLNLPKNLQPLVIVPVGYPAEKPEAPPRVSKNEAVEFLK